MYGNFNMGAGFAIFMPEQGVAAAQRIAMEKYGWQSSKAGYINEGPRQVVIRPKGITYKGDALWGSINFQVTIPDRFRLTIRHFCFSD